MRIVHTRSRELFILAVVALALGTAVGSAELFGVSLALGAFLAGIVIGESSVSHQVGAEVAPFRETFAVLFFVSVGMLVNISYLIANAGQVLALTALIVIGKFVITLLLGAFFPPACAHHEIMAAGLSQIGEFSFIVGQAGVSLGVLTQDQYSLILAGALLTILVNPLMFRAIAPVESLLQRIPALWRLLDRHGSMPQLPTEHLVNHVVIVGYGRVGKHIVNVLGKLNIPRLVIEKDGPRAEEFEQQGVPVLFGDAANSEILSHAGLDHARALVVTVPDKASAEMIVAGARDLAPKLPIVARAATQSGVERLIKLGVNDVIYPELEGALEVLRSTLLTLDYPLLDVQQFTDAVRRDQYDLAISSPEERRALDQLLRTVRGMEIAWVSLSDASPVVNRSLADVGIRENTDASIIAILRNDQIIANPKSATLFLPGDIVGLIGDAQQVAQARQLLRFDDAPSHTQAVLPNS